MGNIPDKSKEPTMQDLLRLARTPQGQKILARLNQEGGDSLRQAMAKASAGDYSQAKALISGLISGDEMQSLLEQLGGK